jgi:hypothetical protein
MKRTILLTLAATICVAFVGARPSFAMRDPIGNADGMNLYEYCGSDPVARTDPTGLWKGGAHRTLTGESLDKAFPAQIAGDYLKCKTYVLDTLVTANLGQDDGAAFDDLRRHYNRAPSDTPAAANTAYTGYLKEETDRFNRDLNAVKGECDSKDKQLACGTALKDLGKLSHAWQDYFAHAVLLSGAAGPAWAANPQKITGTPDAPNPQLKASSWVGSYWIRIGPLRYPGYDTAEHGISEPADRDDRDGRYADAKSFVADKFAIYVIQWYRRCRCCCPPKY